LSAESAKQKEALLSQCIMLDPWELVCFIMFKALSKPNIFTTNANELDPSDFFSQRLDKHRMLLIILTRMFRSLQKLAKDEKELGAKR